MIKGFGFGKLLKQLFIISLISCFGLLANCFVSASYEGIVGQFKPSEYNSQLQINVLKKGSFLTQYLGTTKDVFLIDNDIFFLRGPDGRLYTHFYYKLHNNYRYFEGYMPKYCSCDEFTGGVLLPSNCSCFVVDSGTVEIYSNFLKTVDSNDWYYYNYNQPVDDTMRFDLCISSSSLHSSLCWLNSCTMYGSCNGLYGNELNLGNNVNFSQLNGYPSPAVVPGQIDGGSSIIDINNSLPGDVVRTYCSNQRALDWYENNGYSNRLCYGGLNDFSYSTGVVPIAGQGLEFTDIRFELGSTYEGGVEGSGMSDIEFFSYWRSLYDLYKKGVYNINPFNNVPTVLFTYFGFVDVYGGQFNNKSILDYCFLKNNLTGDSYNNDYNGVNYRNICVNPILDYSSGVVNAVSSDWSGILSGGSNSGNTFTNGVNYVQSYFNLLKTNYRSHVGDLGFGYLPTYIIIFFMAIIVFRFISH